MDNKEMRKEFEIWAKENYLKMGVDKEEVPHMFELYKDGTYNFYGVDTAYAAYVSYLEGYKEGNKFKEEVFDEKPINNEDELESLYWEFDSQRSKKTTDERLLFKGKLRYYASIVKNNVETTKPIWTWEEYKNKVLPQVGAIVEDNNRAKAEILFNKHGFIGFLCETDGGNPSILSEGAFLSHFKPLETPQQKYSRERSEFVKSIEVPAYVWKDSVSDFKAGLSVAYERLKPFKEGI